MDLSKAFDSISPDAVKNKFSRLLIPGHIYSWIESFFKEHFHCNNVTSSDMRARTLKIIHRASIGPVSYVIMVSDFVQSLIALKTTH